VEVLLEVMTQRHVDERPPAGVSSIVVVSPSRSTKPSVSGYLARIAPPRPLYPF